MHFVSFRATQSAYWYMIWSASFLLISTLLDHWRAPHVKLQRFVQRFLFLGRSVTGSQLQVSRPKVRCSPCSSTHPTWDSSMASRTTKGCWTCRIRKKKCDEGRPSCGPCAFRQIICYGYGEKPWFMYKEEDQKAEIE